MKTKIILAFTIGLIAGGFICLIVLNWKTDLPMYHRVGMSKGYGDRVISMGDTVDYNDGNTDLRKVHSQIYWHRDSINRMFVTKLSPKENLLLPSNTVSLTGSPSTKWAFVDSNGSWVEMSDTTIYVTDRKVPIQFSRVVLVVKNFKKKNNVTK